LSTQKVSIRHIKAARALLGWTQDDLAAHSGVSQPTIKRLEADGGDLGGRDGTQEKIRRALERAGIEFNNGDEPGVLLKKKRR